jgi:hemerythrin
MPMTKLLTWRDEWSLGIEPLDRDHRALIERMGDLCVRYCPELTDPRVRRYPGLRLLGAFARPGEELPGLLSDLTDLGERMRAHFRREESFMRAIGYERRAEHEGEHAILMAEYSEMLRGWRERQLAVFDEPTQESVRRWILDHILGTDRGFAQVYFRICGQDAPRVGFG